MPVGATKMTWGGNEAGSTDWFDAELEEVGAEAPVRYDDADGAPIEEVAELAPDLILATNSGITEAEYDKLTKIAPVVAYPEAPWITPGRPRSRWSARRSAAATLADEVAADTEATIDAGQGRTTRELQGAADLRLPRRRPTSPRRHLRARRTRASRSCATSAWSTRPRSPTPSSRASSTARVSAERAADLDSDVFLTWVENADDMQTFADDKLLGQIPAIAVGHAYAETDKSVAWRSTNPSPLSIPVIVERLPARTSSQAVEGDAERPSSRPAPEPASAGRRRRRSGTPSPPPRSSRRWSSCRCASVLVGSPRWSPLGARRRRRPPAARRSSQARFERTLLALAVGAALGLAGACMQGLTRNPLADPGILGINAGAAFAMVLGDLGLRRLRRCGLRLVRLRRRRRRRASWSTSSPRSAATARPRSSWPSPAPRSPRPSPAGPPACC